MVLQLRCWRSETDFFPHDVFPKEVAPFTWNCPNGQANGTPGMTHLP